MAFGISNKGRTSPIAIDFGADALKMLQIVPGPTPQLIAAGTAVIPDHARKDFGARLEFLEESVKALLKSQPFRGRRAMCAIPGFQTLIHNFMLGRCDPEDINALVDLQLEQLADVVQEPARMVTRNFHALDHFRGGTPRSDVVTLSAKRDVVMQYLQLAGRCKLEVVGMHPEPLCLLRGFGSLQNPQDDDQTVCLVDLGSATTKVLIAHGEKLLLAKTIHAAGEHWNRRFAARQKLEFNEARKQRVRSIHNESTGGGTALAEAPPASKRCEIADTLVDELRLCLRHHNGRHPEQPIERVVFFGGEARRDELCRQLAGAMGVAGQLGDPFEMVFAAGNEAESAGIDLKTPQPGWAVAMGLCHSEANL